MKDKIYNFFKLSGEYAFYGLLFFLPISNAMLESFFGFVLFSFVVRKIIKPDFSYLKSCSNLFLLFFFIFIGLSTINSGQNFDKSVWAWLVKWGGYIGLCFITQDTIKERRIAKRALIIFLLSSGLVVLSGLSQLFLGFEFLRGRSLMYVNNRFLAVTSVFKHYNSLAAYIVVVIPLVLGLLLSEIEKKKKAAILLFIFLFLLLFIIISTFSRGSWLGLLFSLFLMLVMLKKPKSRLIVLAVIAIFLLFFILSVFISASNPGVSAQLAEDGLPASQGLGGPLVTFQPAERFLSTFQPYGDSDRFLYWRTAWKMISEHPFLGMGAGTFMANFSKFLPGVNISYAHNCYLQIWAESGMFSILSFLIYIGCLFWSGVRTFIPKKDYLLFGLCGGFLAYLVHAFFEVSLYSLPLAVLFWVWAGIISALSSQANRQDKQNTGI